MVGSEICTRLLHKVHVLVRALHPVGAVHELLQQLGRAVHLDWAKQGDRHGSWRVRLLKLLRRPHVQQRVTSCLQPSHLLHRHRLHGRLLGREGWWGRWWEAQHSCSRLTGRRQGGRTFSAVCMAPQRSPAARGTRQRLPALRGACCRRASSGLEAVSDAICGVSAARGPTAGVDACDKAEGDCAERRSMSNR